MILRKEVIEQLSRELSLPFTGIEQDWDIEMASPHRLNDFLKYYRSDLSADKKVAIVSLILASYEEFLNENNLEMDNRWNEIKSIIESERALFEDLIDYWSLNNEVDENNLFRVTPLIRRIK